MNSTNSTKQHTIQLMLFQGVAIAFASCGEGNKTILSDTHFRVHHLVSRMVPPTDDVHHFFIKPQFIFI
jgi:hypothetical protein